METTWRTIAAALAVVVSIPAQAETYHVKRGGMENARFDLKADKAGYQWLQFAACNDSWWKKGTLSDYPAQIEAEVKSLYGGRPRCNKTGYPADLWWAQYRPGGRVPSTHTVCWDSNILKEAAKADPATAAIWNLWGGREEADLTGKNAYNTQHNRRKERIHDNRKSTRWKAVCGKSARAV